MVKEEANLAVAGAIASEGSNKERTRERIVEDERRQDSLAAVGVQRVEV
jgi:hypothetical protein